MPVKFICACFLLVLFTVFCYKSTGKNLRQVGVDRKKPAYRSLYAGQSI